jgi:hypothetical protein
VAEDEAPASGGASEKDPGEQLRKIKVADVVVQAVSGLVSLGFIRLAGDQLDLAQARLAIDSLRALEPVLREQVSSELGDELMRAITSLQLAYAEAASAETAAQPPSDTAAEAESEEQAGGDSTGAGE